MSGSSFQVNAQSPDYVPAEPFQPWIPLPIYVYVGGQQPANTFALSGFTNCPAPQAIDTTATDVGVKELRRWDNFRIYPNPANSTIHLTLKENKTALNTYSIKITDIMGKEILAENYKEEICISHLEKGIYFLSLYQNGSLLSTKKVVKD